MEYRRLLGISEIEPMTLLFYAPLTVDKLPTYTWDIPGVFTLGNASIVSGALNIPSNSAQNSIQFNSNVPIDKDLTFSMWCNPIYNNNSGNLNLMHGYLSYGNTPNIGGCFNKHYQFNYNSLHTKWAEIASNDMGLIPENLWTFVTFSLIFNTTTPPKLILYYNGVKQGEWTQWIGLNTSLIREGGKFCIGSLYGGNLNCQGNFNHFSVYEELTDQQVLNLYNNGGVPM